MTVRGYTVVRLFVCLWVSYPRFIQLLWAYMLHCAHKRIVNIIEVYIERNNMQVVFIRFRKKKVDFVHVYVCERRNLMFTALFATWQHAPLPDLKVNILHQQKHACCLHVIIIIINLFLYSAVSFYSSKRFT